MWSTLGPLGWQWTSKVRQMKERKKSAWESQGLLGCSSSWNRSGPVRWPPSHGCDMSAASMNAGGTKECSWVAQVHRGRPLHPVSKIDGPKLPSATFGLRRWDRQILCAKEYRTSACSFVPRVVSSPLHHVFSRQTVLGLTNSHKLISSNNLFSHSISRTSYSWNLATRQGTFSRKGYHSTVGS